MVWPLRSLLLQSFGIGRDKHAAPLTLRRTIANALLVQRGVGQSFGDLNPRKTGLYIALEHCLCGFCLGAFASGSIRVFIGDASS
jgi:hypothetical protein